MQGLRTGVFRHGQSLGHEIEACWAFDLARGKAAQTLEIIEGTWGFTSDLYEQFIV